MRNPWRRDPKLDKYPKCYTYDGEPVESLSKERLSEIVGELIELNHGLRAAEYDRSMALADRLKELSEVYATPFQSPINP